MIIFRSKYFRKNPHSGETSWEKELDDRVYSRRKPKSGMIICVGLLATLFFSIGFLLAILSFFVLRDTSVKPSRIIGFIFVGIGAILYIPFVQMCIVKWWKPRTRLVSDETPEGLVSPEDGSKRRYFVPQSRSARKTDLEQTSLEQNQRLLGPPTLAQPEMDDITPAGSITIIIDPPPDSSTERLEDITPEPSDVTLEPNDVTNFDSRADISCDDKKNSDQDSGTIEVCLSPDTAEQENVEQHEDKTST